MYDLIEIFKSWFNMGLKRFYERRLVVSR